jgi:membrane dipeptidase
VLVSPRAEESTLDRYADEIEYLVELAGIGGVGIGFDFFEFIYRRWSTAERAAQDSRLTPPNFLPDLSNHGQARNLTRKLIERGFADDQIAQILYGNWMRVFEQVLTR